ncbi:MAG: hypothetical protein QOI98_2200 [Solirubrobacteraceae bacterium]|jgi:hypothetical protein|nr:hypothetical protein [Solirubrobacteraceae bacterium]
MSTRGLLARVVPPLLIIGAGVAVAATSDSSLGTGVSAFLVGVGFVIAIATVFLEVGLSEDRQRARDETARTPGPDAADSGRRSLPRRRGGH